MRSTCSAVPALTPAPFSRRNPNQAVTKHECSVTARRRDRVSRATPQPILFFNKLLASIVFKNQRSATASDE